MPKAACGKTKAGKARKKTKKGTCRKPRAIKGGPIGDCFTWDNRKGYRWTTNGPCSSKALKSKRYLNRNKVVAAVASGKIGTEYLNAVYGREPSMDSFFGGREYGPDGPEYGPAIKPVGLGVVPPAGNLDALYAQLG